MPNTKAKKLYIVTAFIGESGYKYKKGTPQLTSAKSPNVTSEIESVDVPKISISNSEETVKKNSYVDEADSAYMKAVESGDMETAQRLVDEAAKRAGYFEYYLKSVWIDGVKYQVFINIGLEENGNRFVYDVNLKK